MTKYAMVINISRCTACYCCFTACKDEYWENDYPPYTAEQPRHGQLWLDLVKNERGKHPFIKVAYMPVPCMQCADAPCINAAKDGAVYKRPDGIVVIDPVKAKGQDQIVKSCPYGVISWNEEKKLPQKCTFCVHRLEAGEVPRCVQACPSDAMTFGDLDDPNSEVSRLVKSAGAEAYRPELNTGPGVYYIDLYKMTKYFIAGTAVFGDTDDCAEGVIVTLTGDGKTTTTKSDSYGSFEFDALDTGTYQVKLEMAGYKPWTTEVKLVKDKYLGDIILSKS